MKEPKHTHIKERFILAWIIIALVAFLAVIGTAAALRGQLPSPSFRSQGSDSPACVTVGCAHLGDDATYVLHGQVTAIQSPQPGVVCVQVQSRSSAGDYCAASK